MKHSFKKSVLFVMIALTLAFSAAGVSPAHAAGIRYAKPSATGTGNCSSWANACTLQTALTGAASGDEIWVMAGMHKPTTGTDRAVTFQLKNGVVVYGGFDGTETGLSQRNPAANLTTLSGEIGAAGNSDNSYHVVTGITGATLDGFTVTAGNANGTSPNNLGGGMYNSSSSPTMTNVTFSGNTASSNGGGMYNNNSSPALTDVTFSSNSAFVGGGMHNYNSSSPALTDVTFSANSAITNGGGMYNHFNSSPMLTDVTFSDNSADYGGGMYNYYSGSIPTLTDVIFSDNTANYDGGGMYSDSSSPTLTNVTFSGNSAATYGGGMYNFSNSPTLTNVTFSGNTAYSGGGMYSDSSNPTLTNVTFSGNSAANYGGGMFNDFSSPTLTNVTFSGNTAYSGGGMTNGVSNPTLTNVTFDSNEAIYIGGGMYNWGIDGSPTLTNVTFSDNSANNGGGMFNYYSRSTLTNVTFSGNTANYGGGMQSTNSNNLTLTNVTFSANSAINEGGGMFSDSSSPTLTNVTFSGNSADEGGGMYNWGSLSNPQIRNTIFWGNTAATAGAQIYIFSGTPVVSDSVVQDGYIGGANIITADPKFGALGNYGGFTQTIPLLAGSSAIDTGNDAVCPADDQRGRTRPQGAHCDIGAYEANATLTVRSVGANDGWILESGENTTKGGTKDNTATTFNLGDGAADKQYRAILSFNTINLPDTAVITKVTLKIRKQGQMGTNPFTILGGLKVDMRKPYFGANAGLVISDFQAAAGKSAVATFGATPVGSWYSALLNATGRAYVNKTGTTQFRLRFVTGDNDDMAADYMKFFSGNYATATARPTLIIEYYIP